MSSRRRIIIGLAGVVLAAGATAGYLASRAGSVEATVTTASAAVETDLSLVVDETLTPERETVPGLAEGDPPRPLGRIVYGDGETADLVLGELIVAASEEDLAGFLERHDGTLLDSSPPDDLDLGEHLVRVPLESVDPARAALGLVTAEEGHAGEYQVSDPLLLTMIVIAAEEKTNHGLDVSLNWLSAFDAVSDGHVAEDPNTKDPFEWSYYQVGGQVDTGVVAAWQLLDYYGKTGNEVEILIADGGFFENNDFPDDRKIRFDQWNEANPGDCGDPCPWHGTSVALTAMAKIDNGFGTAGVAGQVGTLIAVQAHGDFWTEMRKIKRAVDEERPAVVNMSFGWEVKTFRAASQDSVDRHIKAMRNDGALVFAAAGNDGKDVDARACIGNHCYENRLHIPCESKYAICVGGYDPETGWLHQSSNYGPVGDSRSVQIYAPYCVIALHNPVLGASDTDWTCGTSFSSPFLAGAAALVEAADPSLDDDEIWEILSETANVGGVHFDHLIPTEQQLRVNVLDAVARALGVSQTAPVVTIQSPTNGFELGVTEWFELVGTAIDFKGQPLSISWKSSIDGSLGSGLDPRAVFEPSAGTHVITATAVDVNGRSGSATITVEVVDLPPEMSISWPTSQSLLYETEDLDLVGLSEDPDTYQSIPEDAVTWEIVRNGQVVFTTGGHIAGVPGGTLTPGGYTVVLRGGDGGGDAETSVDITILEVVGHIPNAVITTQFQDGPYGYGGGSGVELTLKGLASDFEDGVIPGTSFRWIASSDDGHVEVLCTGSTFSEPVVPDDDEDGGEPGFAISPSPTIPPVFGTFEDCGAVDVTLGLAPGAVGQTRWAIVLEVSDSDGQVGRDVAEILVVFAVP